MSQKALKKFKKIYVEITNVCNLRCSFCPPTIRKPGYMSKEEFIRILEQVKGHTEHLYFHVKGEPFLHSELGEFLEESHKRGYKINITTNGTLISSVKEQLIHQPALRQINFSLQSFEEADHCMLAAGEKEAYVKRILEFIKEAHSKTSIIMTLRLWNLNPSESDECHSKNMNTLRLIQEVFNTSLDENKRDRRGFRLADRVFLSQSPTFEWPDMHRDIIGHKGFCHGLKDQAGILVDGTVVPCCLDSSGDISLGNIFNTPFEDIVNGDRAERIRTGFKNRIVIEDLCKRCGFRKRFD